KLRTQNTTPDISHTDQLTFGLRFLENGSVVEKFVAFVSKVGHKAVNMETAVLNRPVQLVPKRLLASRWSARVDVSTALYNNYDSFKEALEVIVADSAQSPKTKTENKGVLKQMLNLETGVMLSFWKDVYEKYETKFWQKDGKISTKCDYGLDTKRRKKRKLLPGKGHDEDTVFDGNWDMEMNMQYMVIENIVSELKKRKNACSEINECFGFLTELVDTEDDVIKEKCK
ncbi:hypothetical protein ILUMI_13284, partial [Ignelater luminosus]